MREERRGKSVISVQFTIKGLEMQTSSHIVTNTISATSLGKTQTYFSKETE